MPKLDQAALAVLLETFSNATLPPWTAVQSGSVWKGVPHIDTPGHTRGGQGELFSIPRDAIAYIDRFERRLQGEELREACFEQAARDELWIARVHNAFPELYVLASFALKVKSFLAEHGPTVAEIIEAQLEAAAIDSPELPSIPNTLAARAYEELLSAASELL